MPGASSASTTRWHGFWSEATCMWASTACAARFARPRSACPRSLRRFRTGWLISVRCSRGCGRVHPSFGRDAYGCRALCPGLRGHALPGVGSRALHVACRAKPPTSGCGVPSCRAHAVCKLGFPSARCRAAYRGGGALRAAGGDVAGCLAARRALACGADPAQQAVAQLVQLSGSAGDAAAACVAAIHAARRWPARASACHGLHRRSVGR